MRQLYKIFPIILAVGLVGCDNETYTKWKSKLTLEDQEIFVSKLPDSAPIVRVGVINGYPPYSFQDDYGNIQGFDIDSMRAIGEEQGFKVEFYKETEQQLLKSILSGKNDMAVSGITYQKDLTEKYGVSKPYFHNPATIMYVKPELNIKDFDDLKGLRVGVLEDSVQAEELKKLKGVEVVTAKTSFLAYESLMQNRSDAIIDSRYMMLYITQNYPENIVTMVSYEDESDPTAGQIILVSKKNKALLKDVNKGIAKLKESGGLEQIHRYWLDDHKKMVSKYK